MSEYKTTLIGQETYLQTTNKSLFDYMGLPAGINKDILTNNILMRSGEFEALYADPTLNQQLIAIWANRYYDTFNRWIKALKVEYNPLENFNRHEIIKDLTGEKEKGSNNSKISGTDSNNTTLTHDTNVTSELTHDTTVTSELTHDTTVTSEVTYDSKVETDDVTDFDEAAYNESTASPKTKTTLDGEVNKSGSDTTETTTTGSDTTETTTTGSDTTETTTTGDDTTNSSGSMSRNSSGSNEVNKDTTYTRDAHLYGNIGVTTSQQMLNAELDIGYWNIYEKITDLFLREFCLLVY